MANHYERLGVAQDASPDEINKAYRKLARRYHPDRLHMMVMNKIISEKELDAEKEKMTIAFRELKEAYDILKDNRKRQYYNDTLKNQTEAMDASPSSITDPLINAISRWPKGHTIELQSIEDFFDVIDKRLTIIIGKAVANKRYVKIALVLSNLKDDIHILKGDYLNNSTYGSGVYFDDLQELTLETTLAVQKAIETKVPETHRGLMRGTPFLRELTMLVEALFRLLMFIYLKINKIIRCDTSPVYAKGLMHGLFSTPTTDTLNLLNKIDEELIAIRTDLDSDAKKESRGNSDKHRSNIQSFGNNKALVEQTIRARKSLHASSLERAKFNQDKVKAQFLSQFKVTHKDTSGKYSCSSALTICKFAKWNRPKVYEAKITEEVIGKLLKNDLTIQGLPKFISDFLNLKPSRHRETLAYRPELIGWTPCEQYLLMPNPAYTNHQLLLEDPARAKNEKEGFALVAWFIHPTLLAQSSYSQRLHILDSLRKNNESFRYGKFGSKSDLSRSLFRVNSFSDLSVRDNKYTTDEIVQKSGIPYISGAFDYKPEHVVSLKLLRDYIHMHLRDIYGITEQDRVDLYFHTHYDIVTTTAHLHVRVNQIHHGLELSRSVFLNDVIDCLEQGRNVIDLFIEKECIHVGPNAHQFLQRIGYDLQEVDNPYYVDNVIEGDTGEYAYTLRA